MENYGYIFDLVKKNLNLNNDIYTDEQIDQFIKKSTLKIKLIDNNFDNSNEPLTDYPKISNFFLIYFKTFFKEINDSINTSNSSNFDDLSNKIKTHYKNLSAKSTENTILSKINEFFTLPTSNNLFLEDIL